MSPHEFARQAATTAEQTLRIAVQSSSVFVGTAITGSRQNSVRIVKRELTPSDKRIKDKIEPLRGNTAIVRKLAPVSFYWRAGTGHSKTAPGKQLGLIAQEVQEVLPEIVTVSGYAVGAEPRNPTELVGEKPTVSPLPERLAGSQKGDKLSAEDALIIAAHKAQTQRLAAYNKGVADAEGRLPKYEADMASYKQQLELRDELTDLLAVDYVKLVPVLLGALNEALDRIETLEAKLA